jgi:hypothetical protein
MMIDSLDTGHLPCFSTRLISADLPGTIRTIGRNRGKKSVRRREHGTNRLSGQLSLQPQRRASNCRASTYIIRRGRITTTPDDLAGRP